MEIELLENHSDINSKKPKHKQPGYPKYVYLTIRDTGKEQRKEKYKLIIECSKVMDEISEELQELLTITNRKGQVLNPRQSFISVCKKRKFKQDNIDGVINKFIEIFHTQYAHIIQDLKKAKEENKNPVKIFGEYFDSLFTIPGHQKKIIFKKTGTLLVRFFLFYERILGTALYGLGKDNPFVYHNH